MILILDPIKFGQCKRIILAGDLQCLVNLLPGYRRLRKRQFPDDFLSLEK